jgi:signal transduction histidine kinase
VVLAVVLLGAGESQVFAGWNDGGVGLPAEGHYLARALLVLAFAAPLAWRRRRPLTAVSVTSAAIVLQLLAVAAYVPFLVGLLPLAIGNFTAAASGARWRLAGLVAVFTAEAVIYVKIPQERTGGEVLFAVFVLLGTWMAGDVVRARLRRADQAVARAQTTVAEYEAATEQILAQERARIARELHDVIAHSVSVMGVQAGAARSLMDADPEAARAALRAIEGTARTSVGELERLLTVLRDQGDTAAGRAPQPGLAQLPALVAGVRQAGLPVELSMPGLTSLPDGVGLAAYRIVQEALTNALKHAGTSATVNVKHRNDQLVIEVRNGGPAAAVPAKPGGHGLIGMRERASLYGGSIQAGPEPDGGFFVQACLPVLAGQDA